MTFRRRKKKAPAFHHLTVGPVKSEYFLDAIDEGRAKLATARVFFNRNRMDPNLPPLSGDDVYLLKIREYAHSFWSRPDIDINNSCLIKAKIATSIEVEKNQVKNAATTLSILKRIIMRNEDYKIYSLFNFKHLVDHYLYLECLIIVPCGSFIDMIEILLTEKARLQSGSNNRGTIEIEPITLTARSLREEAERTCHYTRGSLAERSSSVDAAIQAHAIAKVIGGLPVRGIAPQRRMSTSNTAPALAKASH